MMPAKDDNMIELPNTRKSIIIMTVVLLALFTLIAYLPARSNNFISFDDDSYITENPHIKDGITLNAIKWAFTEYYSYNYHPLTWLTHMADISLFGLNPAGHHLTNVFFHCCNVVLLFLTLTYMTKQAWGAFIVSALFALVPVNVETISWVSERKNLLSTFFWFLTILSYTRYVKRRDSAGYALTIICFLLGLLSKPMLVTLPFVLLLLDFWPLRRFTAESTKKLFIEKLPFIGLSLIFIFITIFTQKSGGNVVPLYMLPAGIRLENTFLSYVRYIEKIFWPYNFSIFYPYVLPKLILPVIASVGVVLVITSFSIMKRQRYPWLFTGWFWFAGTLIPVIQLVQVGWASMADRYAYIPQIGIFIALSWSLVNLLKEKTYLQKPMALVFILIMGFLYMRTHEELKHWRNSETLYLHAMEVTNDNYVALGEYGLCLMNKGKVRESIPYFLKALAILPDSPTLNYYTWKAYKTIGEPDAANRYFLKASPLLTGDTTPPLAKMLGVSLLKIGRYTEARDSFMESLKISNTDTEIYEGLAQALIGLNKKEEALKFVETGLQLKPDAPGLLKLKRELSCHQIGKMKNDK
ncbi:tetratricopeptide repeat protein [Candidatus Magnetomonas plexicatena]|uniref:tetratricopeptide repeat protein n=1 Tax=Candidatus Magnetomonas plexicatena TaxID=2552947 RepID=UPI0011023FAB|nr:hypothetical protein E2O03_014205 [Nitrospirales bacterium LBB_01]